MVFSYIVGNFYVVGKTLWGIHKNSSQCRRKTNELPHNAGFSTKNKTSPQCLIENLDVKSYIVGNSYLQIITKPFTAEMKTYSVGNYVSTAISL